jgi:predicted alpha-1,6-mannanase (GH76 family)
MRTRVALSCVLTTAASLGLSHAARADQAADAFQAWSKAFLFENNGQAYFSGGIITPGQTPDDIGGWVDATVIYVAEDVYEREPTAANRALVEKLVTTFLQASGTNWSGDGWNDDLGWMITTALRGYQITGTQQFYTVAETNWNTAYNRGWDTQYAGGGVWEKDPANGGGPTSKCALDNDPLIRTGLLLYQFTGDSSYLQKSQNMYGWMKSHLVDASGQVNGCIVFNANDTVGHIQGGSTDNVYDTGSFLEASEYIYRLTGT